MFQSLPPLFNRVFTTRLNDMRSINKHPNHFTAANEARIFNLPGTSYAFDMVHLMVSANGRHRPKLLFRIAAQSTR